MSTGTGTGGNNGGNNGNGNGDGSGNNGNNNGGVSVIQGGWAKYGVALGAIAGAVVMLA